MSEKLVPNPCHVCLSTIQVWDAYFCHFLLDLADDVSVRLSPKLRSQRILDERRACFPQVLATDGK